MTFSEKMGRKSIKRLQIEAMDEDLKTSLWNAYLELFIRRISGVRAYQRSDLDKYFDYLWSDYFKQSIDQRNNDYDYSMVEIKKKYSVYNWHEVYSFIEFHTNWNYRIIGSVNIFPLIDECNRVLEREFSAYRIVDKDIVPISNSVEFDEIRAAANVGVSFFNSKYKGANIHLKEALSKLSDKKSPDYRNSIKESISAVEAVCRQLTGESTLGEALKKLESKGITLNPQFRAGIEKFYAYTNSKDSGIRHALIEDPDLPTFHDAKFMLVICSAFINLVISKVN
jgi:hypothetical protein